MARFRKQLKAIRKFLMPDVGDWVYTPSTESVRDYEQSNRNKRALADYYSRSYAHLKQEMKL